MAPSAYKGWTIHPTPYQLDETKQWRVSFTLSHETESGTIFRPFSTADTFTTKDEAAFHCFNCAKQIIDTDISKKADL